MAPVDEPDTLETLDVLQRVDVRLVQENTAKAISLFETALQVRANEGLSRDRETLDVRRSLGRALRLELRFDESAGVLREGVELAGEKGSVHDLLCAELLATSIQGRLEDHLLDYVDEKGDPEQVLRRVRDQLRSSEQERNVRSPFLFQVEATLGGYLRIQNRWEEACGLLEESKNRCEALFPLNDPTVREPAASS